MDGTFELHEVPPGKIEIGRSVAWSYAGHSASGISHMQHLSVPPGQTARVTLGGAGRPVVGKLVIPADIAGHDLAFGICNLVRQTPPPPLPMPDNVKNGSILQQQQWYEQFLGTPADAQYEKAKAALELLAEQLPLQIAADDTFRIEDVTGGSYTLYADLYANGNFGAYKKGDRIARAEMQVDVPDVPGGRSDQPLRLPDTALESLNQVPHVGDLAPDFSTPTLAGESLKLSDFRGKYVLLDFWATWCGSCLQETPNIKNIYNEFEGGGRLAIISLSLDDRTLEPSHYVHVQDIRWPQAYVGPHSAVTRDYGVEGIPSIWLIGPDGKVIATHLRSEKIRAAVAKALATP
jgi:peroxiredoxin